jgi:hypothetical protein
MDRVEDPEVRLTKFRVERHSRARGSTGIGNRAACEILRNRSNGMTGA